MDRVRIPNTVPAQHLLPYLEHLDATQTYSNFGALNLRFVERLRADVFGSQFHITTHSSGTQALIASVLATAGYAKPDKKYCLIASYTFVATAAVARNCGYEPFFVDLDPQNLTMDIKSHLAGIPWDQIGVIMPTCPFGITGGISELIEIASARDIPIVIDAAAAFDTFSQDFQLGSDAVFCMSTHATKSFNSGEGGLAFCKRPDLSRKIRAISNFGMDGSRISKFHGTNSKMSEYHAAVGLANLDVWDYHQKRLEAVRSDYRTAFNDRNFDPSRLKYNDNCSLAYFLLEVPRRDFVTARLRKQNIDFRNWYGFGLHTTPLYENQPTTTMRHTDSIAPKIIGLPMHIYLERSEIDLIADAVCALNSQAYSVI